MGGIGSIDREAVVALSCSGIRFGSFRIPLEPRQDRGCLGGTRSRFLPRDSTITGTAAAASGSAASAPLEGTEETLVSRALEDRLVGLRPRSCRGEKEVKNESIGVLN